MYSSAKIGSFRTTIRKMKVALIPRDHTHPRSETHEVDACARAIR
jgi:hypothetical protein